MELAIPSIAVFLLGVSGRGANKGIFNMSNLAVKYHFIFSVIVVLSCVTAILVDHGLRDSLVPVISLIVGRYIGMQEKGKE
jgi:hypothetical protein